MAALMRADRWHPQVMTAAQRAVLARLGPIADREDCYLAGGTALALHYGHRRSVDLDWFTRGSIEDPLALAARIRDAGVRLEVGQVSRGTLHGTVNRVRVSFIEFRYPLLARTTLRAEAGCAVAAVRDIACMKLAAIAQRGSRKDFVDFWALLAHHRRLPAMLEDYRKKFAVRDVSSVLYGLGYFDEAEAEPLPTMLVPVGWPQIRTAVAAALKQAARRESAP